MDAWAGFERAVDERHGVSTLALALECGIKAARYYDRTAREGWGKGSRGTRVAPWRDASVQQRVLLACASSQSAAAASRETAAWLHGLHEWPPGRPSVVVRHSTKITRQKKLVVHRARWLLEHDIIEVDHVPTLAIPAMFLTLGSRDTEQVRALLIDAVHRRLTTTGEVLARLHETGPVPGRARLRAVCQDLHERVVESVFQEEVAGELERQGYRPGRSTRYLDTPDGRGANADIPLDAWKVTVEPEGDAFHRTREQRRLDRRRGRSPSGIGHEVDSGHGAPLIRRGGTTFLLASRLACRRCLKPGCTAPTGTPPVRWCRATRSWPGDGLHRHQARRWVHVHSPHFSRKARCIHTNRRRCAASRLPLGCGLQLDRGRDRSGSRDPFH